MPGKTGFMVLRKFIFCIAWLALPFCVIAGGGWPQPKGGGFFKLNQTYLTADEYFTASGAHAPTARFSVYSTSLYGEYGITSRLTGLLYAPFFVGTTVKETLLNGFLIPDDALSGIGDIEIGLKYNLINKGPIILSASILLDFPLGENAGGKLEVLQTGDGEFNQQFQLDASHSFYPAPFYTTLSAGFNNRTVATFDYIFSSSQKVRFSDEFYWGGEIGWTPGKHWVVALKWLHLNSLQNGDMGANTGSSSLFSNNVEYFSITPEIGYRFDENWGISGSIGAGPGSRNILAAPNFAFGFYYKWQ